MTGQTFTVVVEYPNGKVKEKVAAIGGGRTSADGLSQQYVDVDAFPGAKKVTIIENEEGQVFPKSLHAMLKARRGMVSKARPRTPHPTVVNPDGNERQAVLRKSDEPVVKSNYAGDNVSSSIPASPFANSKAAQDARERLEPPAETAPAAENESQSGSNESDASRAAAPPPPPPAVRRRSSGGA